MKEEREIMYKQATIEKTLYRSKSTCDAWAWFQTSIYVLLFLMCVLNFVIYDEPLTFLWLALLILYLALLLWGFFSTPYALCLSNSDLIICRHGGKIRIPLCEIHEMRQLSHNASDHLSATWRSFNVFGQSSIYKSKSGQRFHLYTRRYGRWDLVVTADKNYVTSPDDKGFVEAVNEQMEQLNLHIH